MGAPGADGRTLLNGNFPPPDTIGQDGDFYIDTSTWQIHGPKEDGAWGPGVSLIAPGGENATYSAGGGLRLDGTTFSLDPSQRLPTCPDGQQLRRNGTIWDCAPPHTYYFGARNPAGGNVSPGTGGACALGDVWLTATNVAPNALEANGAILSINQWSALYAVIGSKYGGDGRTTFALPDLRDAAPRSRYGGQPVHYVICIEGDFPSYK